MVESGAFRTSINGFNKKDVLDYIDTMQSQHMGELQDLNRQTAQLKQELSDQETCVNELKIQIETLEKEAEELREENLALNQQREDTSRLTADYQRLKQDAEIFSLEKQEFTARISDMQERLTSVKDLEQQIQTLNEQLNQKIAEQEESIAHEKETALTIQCLHSDNDSLTQQLNQTVEQLLAAEQKIKEFQESSSRYDALVGDVGSFIMELHSMGQRFLETAYKRSDSCLKALETSVSALSAQLTDARSQVGQARQELLDHGTMAGMRLDELVQALEESADTIANIEGKIEEPDEETNE